MASAKPATVKGSHDMPPAYTTGCVNAWNRSEAIKVDELAQRDTTSTQLCYAKTRRLPLLYAAHTAAILRLGTRLPVKYSDNWRFEQHLSSTFSGKEIRSRYHNNPRNDMYEPRSNITDAELIDLPDEDLRIRKRIEVVVQGNGREGRVIPIQVRIKAVSKALHGMLSQDNYYPRDMQIMIEEKTTGLDVVDLQSDAGHTILHTIIIEFKPNFLYVLFYLGMWSCLRDTPAAEDKGSQYANLKPKEVAEKLMPKAKGPLVLEEFDYYDGLDGNMSDVMKASLKGNEDDVKMMFIKLTATDFSYKDTSGFNCFPYAVASGKLELCELLLDNQVDPTTTNDRRETALHVAAKLGRSKVIPFLITRCMLDPRQPDSHANRPIDFAALNGDVDTMKAFMDSGVPPDEKCLPLAAKHGRKDMVRFLLDECKLPIAGKDDKQRTALLNACSTGNKELIEQLMVKGADITDQDYQKRNGFHLAADNGHVKVVLFLIETARQRGCLESLINAKDKFCGREIVILVRGRDRGRAAWHYVQIHRCLMHHFRIQLSRGSIDVNDYGMILLSGFGRSPELSQRNDMEDLLVNRLSEPADNPDMTPLHLAAYKEHTEIIKVLLEAGANPNQQDNFDLTALHLAGMRGNMEAAKLLDAHGAEFDIENNEQHTAADIAKANGHDELENFLRGKECIAAAQRGQEALLQTILTEMNEERLENLRREGVDVRRHLVAQLRDMSIDINETLLALGSGPVMEETQPG